MVARSALCLCLLASVANACSKEELMEAEPVVVAESDGVREDPWLEVRTVPMSFELKQEEGVKAFLSGTHFSWVSGDKIGLYDNLRPTKHQFTLHSVSADGGTASVTGEVTEGSTKWYAVYPQTALTSFSDGNCDLTLPAVQYAGSRNVDESALLAVSYTTGRNLQFHNVFALLTLRVDKSDITHIQIIGNQGSVLAGTVTVNASTGKIVAIKEPVTEIHLYPSGAAFVPGQEYLVPILPYDAEVEGSTSLEGFTAIMYTSSETVEGTPCYIKRTDKTLSLRRGEGQKLGLLTSGTGYSETTLASSTCPGYYNNKLDIRFPGGSSHAYRVALYRDAACTDLVVAHNLPASSLNPSDGVFSASASTFTFGSLEPNTQYWFRGIDRTTGRPTVILTPHVTLSYIPMEMARSAHAGDVILQEDFSECCYGASGDATGKGGPYRTAEVNTTLDAFVPFAGEVREGEAYYKAASEEIRLFPFARNILGETRLSDWAEYSERSGYTSCDETSSTVCARNGLLKIGASKYTGGIVTPPIQCIPAGKKAVVTVTLNARGFGSTENSLSIRSVDGKVTTLSGTNPYINNRFFQVNHTYDTKSATLVTNNYGNVSVDLTVYPGSRILIAADRSVPGTTAGTDECRFYLGRVTLKIKSLSDASTSGNLTFSHVSFQSARVNFPTTSGHNYQVYIDGSTNDPDGTAIATVTGNGSTMYKALSHLYFGTTYQVRVRDVTASTDVGTGYVTTARIWQNSNSTGQRFISIGWDPIYRTEPDGFSQAYQVQVWKSGTKILDLNPVQPGQDNFRETAYAETGILGYAFAKDGTTPVNQGDAQGGPLYTVNYLTPTGVTIGGLDPGTSYDIRVRPRASVTYERFSGVGSSLGTVTVGNTLGPDFKGKSPNTVRMSTDSPHIATPDELLWCGFEDFCIQQDFANRTPGSMPYHYKSGVNYKEAYLWYGAENRGWDELCVYNHDTQGYATGPYGLTIGSTGSVDKVAANRGLRIGDNPPSGYVNNVVVGDFGGWYTRGGWPRMGQLQLFDKDSYVTTPALTNTFLGDKKLSATGTVCRLTFHAVQTVFQNSQPDKSLAVKVWRASQKAWETIKTIPPAAMRPWGDEGVSNTDYYKNDYSKRPSKSFSVDMTLYPGDAVRLHSSATFREIYGILLDDIRLVRCYDNHPVADPVVPDVPEDAGQYYSNPVVRNNCADPDVFDDRARTGYFYAYSTQNASVYLPTYRSLDMVHWEYLGDAFAKDKPDWLDDTQSGRVSRVWAPNMNYIDGKYVLYYACGDVTDGTFSGTGVAYSDSPAGPFEWRSLPNKGCLITAGQMSGSVKNMIDPVYYVDRSSGKAYLFIGSFGPQGLWAVEMSRDGLSFARDFLVETNRVLYGRNIEGTTIHYHDGYYYIFGSNGTCCYDYSSTYHIVVARSKNLLGPYTLKDGSPLVDYTFMTGTDANTILQNTPQDSGSWPYFAGVGHNSSIITDDAGNDWMYYHAYWRGNGYNGRCLCMDKIIWSGGWPSFAGGCPTTTRTAIPFIRPLSWTEIPVSSSTKSGLSAPLRDSQKEALLETGDPCSCRPQPWAIPSSKK